MTMETEHDYGLIAAMASLRNRHKEYDELLDFIATLDDGLFVPLRLSLARLLAQRLAALQKAQISLLQAGADSHSANIERAQSGRY